MWRHLLLLSSLALSHGLRLFEPGKSYLYEVETGLAVGTGGGAYQQAMSGAKFKGLAKFQATEDTVNIKLYASNLRAQSFFNGPFEQGYSPFEERERRTEFELHDEEQLPDYSFSVEYVGGTVKSITVPDEAPVWVKNIMRAFASSFQIDLQNLESEQFWYSQEKMLHGDCKVHNNIENQQDSFYRLKKAVSHNADCVPVEKQEHFRFVNSLDGDTCNQDKKMTPKLFNKMLSDTENHHELLDEIDEQDISEEPLSSKTWLTVDLQKTEEDEVFTVHKLETHGSVLVQPFQEDGVSHYSVVSRDFTLINVTDTVEDIDVTGTTFENLFYQFSNDKAWNLEVDLKEQESFFNNEFAHFQSFYAVDADIADDQETMQDAFYVAMQEFVEEYTTDNVNDKTKEHINNLHKNGILVLKPILMKLNYDSLYSLRERFLQEAEEVRHGVLVKNLFREIVSATGSNPSALLVKEMVMKEEYDNDFTAARELLSVPFHIHRPTKNLVAEFKELLEFDGGDYVKMAAPLAYTTLVRRTCEADYTSDCEQELLKPAVEETFKEFESVDTEDIQELNKYMSMFSNLRWGELYKLLKPIILGQTKHKDMYAIRAKAILAATPGIIDAGLEEEYFLPLIMDEYENHEVRIMAFENLMKGIPSKTTFIKIVTAMYWERDYEVFNYIFTSFERFATSQKMQPCGQRTKEYAQYFLKYWKEHMWLRPKYSFGISKTYSRSFKDEQFGYGGQFEYHTIGSHKSSSPIAVFGEVRGSQFQGHEMQIFGLYVRVQGLGARVMKMIKDFDFFNKKENLNTDALRDILFEQMKVKEKNKEPLGLEIVFKMKNDILFQQYWDENSFGSISEFVKNAQMMVAEGHLSFNEDRIFNFPTLIYEMPTDIGMPIAYDVQAALLGSLNAEFNRDDHDQKIDYSSNLAFQSNNGLSLFYGNKLAFGIRQNRVYKHHFGHQIKFGIENKEAENHITISLTVPEQSKPFSLLMHSETTLEIISNKLTEMPAVLESSCPACKQQYVLTRGENWKKNENFLDLTSEEWGMQAKASYFDCEAPFASSTGNFFDNFASYFNKENKTPRDFYTAFTFGLIQLNSFFLYFPHAESCGLAFEWSQTSYNPVSEMELSFRGDLADNMKSNDGQIRLKGDFKLIGDIVREHQVFIKYEYENDRANVHTLREAFPKQAFSMKLVRKQFDLGAFNVPEYSVCAELNQKLSTENDKYFFLDLNSEQKTLLDGAISFGPSGSCETNDHQFKVSGISSTTEEARKQLKSKWYYYSCMAQKKSKEYTNFPLTDPCLFTADDLYTLRHFKFNIETINLPAWLENSLYKVETWGQNYLLPYWEMELESQQNGFTRYNNIKQEQNVEIDLVFHSRQKTIDLEVQRVSQKSMFKGMKYWVSDNGDVSVEDYLPSSVFSPAMGILHNHDILNYCTASNKHIRTYDNVTYSYNMHDCWTLVSGHCAEDPEYAVFVKRDNHRQMALMVFIGGRKVEILPSSSSRYDIAVDGGEAFDISKDDTYYYPSQTVVANGDHAEKSYMFKIYKWEGTFTIDSFLRTTVHYDGSHVSIVAPPHVKGQQCGMCGDFNRDHRYEMLGPQECQLRNGKEMAAAWSWDKEGSGECPKVERECHYSEENYFVKQT